RANADWGRTVYTLEVFPRTIRLSPSSSASLSGGRVLQAQPIESGRGISGRSHYHGDAHASVPGRQIIALQIDGVANLVPSASVGTVTEVELVPVGGRETKLEPATAGQRHTSFCLLLILLATPEGEVAIAHGQAQRVRGIAEGRKASINAGLQRAGFHPRRGGIIAGGGWQRQHGANQLLTTLGSSCKLQLAPAQLN